MLFHSDTTNLAHDSQARVAVLCDTCKTPVDAVYSDILEFAESHGGRYVCCMCLRFEGKNIFRNPLPPAAYALGWIASVGVLNPGFIDIVAPLGILKVLKEIIPSMTEISFEKNSFRVTIQDTTQLADINKLLHPDRLPGFGNPHLTQSFLRGFFEGSGRISAHTCSMRCSSEELAGEIRDFLGIPCCTRDGEIRFSETNCLDFLGQIYEGCQRYFEPRMHGRYMNLLRSPRSCQILKTRPEAVMPFQSRRSDAGYDLTIVAQHAVFNDVTTLYDTGIQLYLPPGVYVEIMARSSLSKSGYMLANNTAVIDNGYRGNLYIALTRVSPSAPEIQLPFRCCQLIFRQQTYVCLEEICSPLPETERGAGGFGSSDQ